MRPRGSRHSGWANLAQNAQKSVKQAPSEENPRSTSPPGLPQLPNPHPVDPSLDNDLGMLAIADIAAEDPGAAFP